MSTRSSAMDAIRNPEIFKLGLFGYLHEGGNAITTVPERWSGSWNDIAAMARMADRSGLDFLLPIARWKGIPGAVNPRLHSFETLSHAAALSGITERIALFSTVHTPIVHPIVAAKSMATIDHASNGRAGLNIVCGWNQDDFDMFGYEQLPHDARYAQALEWFEIWSKLVSGAGAEPFDYDGVYYKGLKKISGLPGTLQQPHPFTFSAAFSSAGRDYAVKTSDCILTLLNTFENGAKEIADINERVAASGRTKPLQTFGVTTIVCRETRSEAEDFFRYYAEENADHEALDYYIAARSKNATMPEGLYREMKIRIAGGTGGYPLVGTPDDIAEGLIEMRRIGFNGTAICLLNYLNDMPDLVEKVMPKLRKAGIL